jgi:putative FmdB family regulatory protein
VPIYEYRCRNGHQFERFQKMAEDPVERCEDCGAPVERVFHPVAVHFKGSGFYTTDYGRKGSKDGAKAKEESKEPASKESKGSDSRGSDAKGSGGNGGKGSGEKAAAKSSD